MSRPVGGTRTTLGPQVSSKRTSAPNYGFGTGTRATQEKVFVSQEHAALQGNPSSPGPGNYPFVPSVGPQVNGAFESAPLYTFGADERFSKGNKSKGKGKAKVEVPKPKPWEVPAGGGGSRYDD